MIQWLSLPVFFLLHISHTGAEEDSNTATYIVTDKKKKYYFTPIIAIKSFDKDEDVETLMHCW